MYWTCTDTIIFYPEFNHELDVKLLSNYKKIIFSDHAFNENYYKDIYNNSIKKYKNNNKYSNFNNRYSKFNHHVNQIP